MHLRQTRPANAVERNACSTRDYLPPPAGSTDEFAMTWDAIVRSFPPDFFRACDAAMLGQRVACELELRAVQKIVDDLPERYIPMVPAPWCRIPRSKTWKPSAPGCACCVFRRVHRRAAGWTRTRRPRSRRRCETHSRRWRTWCKRAPSLCLERMRRTFALGAGLPGTTPSHASDPPIQPGAGGSRRTARAGRGEAGQDGVAILHEHRRQGIDGAEYSSGPLPAERPVHRCRLLRLPILQIR